VKSVLSLRLIHQRHREFAMPKSRSSRSSTRRAKPGARGGGKFFHIQVRPRSAFVTFRNQDIGARGGIERIAGRRANGSWDTQKWLLGKSEAHLDGKRLVADSRAAEKVLAQLGSAPRRLGGDRFVAKPRRKIPAREKPTPAMRRAQRANIKKAQAAVRKRRRKRA
jgi:hypothetical protein